MLLYDILTVECFFVIFLLSILIVTLNLPFDKKEEESESLAFALNTLCDSLLCSVTVRFFF